MVKRKQSGSNTLEAIFLRLQELVLANSGEDEFEEIFKLLIAKIWDERTGAGLFHSDGSDAEIASRMAMLLRRVNDAWPGVLPVAATCLTPEHLSVCVNALEARSLGDASLESLDGFFEFLVARAVKGAKGQFFTPRHVIEFCIRMLKPQADEKVLDPACGSGGFLWHALGFVRKHAAAGCDHQVARAYAKQNLWGLISTPVLCVSPEP